MIDPDKEFSQSAFAVEYGRKKAPTVLAKATGEDVGIMIQEAKNANIPIMENPYLANLLEGVDIGEEVPESLYTSIAIVLSWVFWLRGDKPF
ncbi:MAG: flagellar biosynthesis protein FlhB [Porticoccaceae bacterium]|jgi:flagellar biosynthesis protein|nr:flagellar biosynthesis protein FlhB [Porticoccaceae bacterium]